MSTLAKKRIAFVMNSGNLPKSGGEINMATLAQSLDRNAYDVHALVRPGPAGAHFRALDITPSEVLPFAPQTQALIAYLMLNQTLDALQESERAGAVMSDCSAIVDALCALPCRDMHPHWSEATFAGPAVEDGFHLSNLPSGARLPPTFAMGNDGVASLMLGRDVMRMRRLLTTLGAEIAVFDSDWDALTGAMALQGTDVECVWYVQMAISEQPQDRVIAPRCKRIITCGRGVAEARFKGATNVSVAANGVDIERFRPKAAGTHRHSVLASVPPDAFLIGMAATLEPRKGQDVLIDACSILATTHLSFHVFFFGADGGFKRALVKRAAGLDLTERMHFEGHRNDVATILPHLDVHVLCSRGEGLPLSLCEAMACGVACIATRLPGTEEVAQETGAALLVPVNNAQAVADALRICIESPDRRAELGRAGRAIVEARFTKSKMVAAFEEALRV